MLLSMNLEDITVTELKDVLRQRGYRTSGKKDVLMQRILSERELILAKREGRELPELDPNDFRLASPTQGQLHRFQPYARCRKYFQSSPESLLDLGPLSPPQTAPPTLLSMPMMWPNALLSPEAAMEAIGLSPSSTSSLEDPMGWPASDLADTRWLAAITSDPLPGFSGLAE
jgi:hypothetical protein